MTTTDTKIAQYLNEAHTMEQALVRTLQAQRAVTPTGPYRSALDRHLRETKEHETRVARRLRDLGHGPSLAERGYGLAQRLVGQAVALGKAPLDMVRGGSPEEKLLKNAKDECATEALEIATYDTIEQLARQANDEVTATLAAEIRADEEQMLASLREQLPALTAAVVGAEIRAPLSEYDELTVEDIVAQLEELTPAQLRHVATYEQVHKRRRGVLDAIERRQQEQEQEQEREHAAAS